MYIHVCVVLYNDAHDLNAGCGLAEHVTHVSVVAKRCWIVHIAIAIAFDIPVQHIYIYIVCTVSTDRTVQLIQIAQYVHGIYSIYCHIQYVRMYYQIYQICSNYGQTLSFCKRGMLLLRTQNACGKPETPSVGLGDTDPYKNAIHDNRYAIYSNSY